jgi:C4-dicarboxylate-specific signal transduction histidine kinase
MSTNFGDEKSPAPRFLAPLKMLSTQPIRRQMLVFAGFLLLPIVIGAIWSANRTRTERRRELDAEATVLAATSAAYLGEFLRGVDSVAAVLVRHPALITLSRQDCNQLFADLLKIQPLILNVVAHARDGTLRCSGLPDPGGSQPRPISSFEDKVVSSGAPVVSDLTIGRETQKPTVIMAYPVRGADGSVVGVLDFGIDLSHLQTMFAAIPLPEGSIITLTDRRGLILARSHDAERFIGTTMAGPRPDGDAGPVGDRGRGNDGGNQTPTVSAQDPDGVERLLASVALDRAGWMMSVGIPSRVVWERSWPLWRRNIFIIAIVVLSSLMLWLWFGRRLSGQLTELREASRRIADGDFSPPPPVVGTLNREVGALQASFFTMSENLRQTRDALDRQAEHERKMGEMVASLQRQVVRQERLAAVGVLVSGVAHELNNPLQAILGGAELLERRPGLSPDALQEIAFIKNQSSRAREIIRNLSRFSRQQTGPPSPVDLRDVVAEVVQLRGTNLHDARIALDVQIESTRKVFANFTELEQVVLNFVINAEQAIQAAGPPQGRMIIRVSDVGLRVRLEVIDNGPGVSPENEAKLFQPFFTTKPVGAGTGLGLSVGYGIVDAYHGTVGYDGSEWGGAVFFFELPAYDSSQPLHDLSVERLQLPRIRGVTPSGRA